VFEREKKTREFSLSCVYASLSLQSLKRDSRTHPYRLAARHATTPVRARAVRAYMYVPNKSEPERLSRHLVAWPEAVDPSSMVPSAHPGSMVCCLGPRCRGGGGGSAVVEKLLNQVDVCEENTVVLQQRGPLTAATAHAGARWYRSAALPWSALVISRRTYSRVMSIRRQQYRLRPRPSRASLRREAQNKCQNI
jgi:hypothetical protein